MFKLGSSESSEEYRNKGHGERKDMGDTICKTLLWTLL